MRRGKMKNSKKRIISSILAVILVLGMSFTVYAESNATPPRLGEIVDGSVLTNDNISDVKYNPSRGNILNRGVVSLSDNGDGTVNVYGAVMGSVVCDKLILEMTLQRLEGSTWVTIKNYSSTAYSQSLLSKSYNPSVTSGYYYRVKAACIATKGSTSEYQMPVTNGLWI
jgi:hypothetical protein